MGRRLGQHFLRSPEIVERILQACRLAPEDRVVEVGPGRGVLTRPLLGRCGHLTAVELDERLCERLREELGPRPNFTLVQGDFLTTLLPEGPLKFVGNLPYAVGGPILRRILRHPGWRLAVVMLQREVAERLIAGPGVKAYGPLTIETALRASVDWISDVPRDCFSPPPNVDSAVVALEPRSLDLGGASEEEVLAAAHACFRQRRKTILNSLSTLPGLDKAAAVRALEGAGIAPGARAETVPMESFIRLARLLPKPSGL